LTGDSSDKIDVNQLAGKFGGGGHVSASGARVFSPLEEVKERLIELIQDF
jgi:nanoRNase/pAp phosphatase (c-di-AMP/oligoRNAs hydrolase)